MKLARILTLICTIALFGCKKKACYVCVTEPYPPTQGISNSVTETKCDMTERDAKDYEDMRTNQNSICKCTKKED